MVLFGNFYVRLDLLEQNTGKHTRIHERSRSHSKSSLPPPELNKRRSERVGTTSSPRSSG